MTSAPVPARITQKANTIRDFFYKPSIQKELRRAIPKHLTVDRLLRVAMTSIQQNPKLLDCTEHSLLRCIMVCAELGLEPSNFLGQAYLVPFKNHGVLEAQLIPGYRGYIALARRSGQVQTVSSQVVYENDHFVLQYGLEDKLEHVPAEGDRGKVKGAYVVFRYKDNSYSFDYMPKSDIDAVRRRSKAANDGPWVTDYAEMAKKTVIKRHAKLAPLSVEFQTASLLEDLAHAGESQMSILDPATIVEHTNPLADKIASAATAESDSETKASINDNKTLLPYDPKVGEAFTALTNIPHETFWKLREKGMDQFMANFGKLEVVSNWPKNVLRFVSEKCHMIGKTHMRFETDWQAILTALAATKQQPAEPESQPQTEEPQASPSDAMTDPQRRKIWAMCTDKEMTRDEAKAFVEKYLGPDATRELASSFIENFDDLFNEYTEGQ